MGRRRPVRVTPIASKRAILIVGAIAALPGANRVVLDAAGHALAFDQPEEVMNTLLSALD